MASEKPKTHFRPDSPLLTPPLTSPIRTPPITPSQTKIRPKSKPAGRAEVFTLAVLAFQLPPTRNYQIKFLIPKDSAAWIEHLTQLIKKHAHIEYMVDKEIASVITRWRTTTKASAKYSKPVVDPDLPESYSWSEEQVAAWIGVIGYPQYKDAFLNNRINGRKLITVDASGLNKIGIQYFSDIKDIALKIREVLTIHRPNMLRSIIRIVPFQKYLEIRSKTGHSYDQVTFESFCTRFGFPYDILRRNKCALIPCLCEVLVQKLGSRFEVEESEDGGSEANSDISLNYAPTVEFTVRHIIVRNKLVQDIINELIQCVFEDPATRKYGRSYDTLADTIREIMEWGYNELFTEDEILERLELAKSVAHELLTEVKRTAMILQDIHAYQKFLKSNSVKVKDADDFKEVAEAFVEEVASIAAMLALGEYELDHIFRQEPEFHEFVDGLIHEAEGRTNKLVPIASDLLRDVVEEAKLRVLAMQLPNLSLEALKEARDIALELLNEMLEDTFEFVEYYGQEDVYPDKYDGGSEGPASTGRHRTASPNSKQAWLHAKKGDLASSIDELLRSRAWKSRPSRGHGAGAAGTDLEQYDPTAPAYTQERGSVDGAVGDTSGIDHTGGSTEESSVSGVEVKHQRRKLESISGYALDMNYVQNNELMVGQVGHYVSSRGEASSSHRGSGSGEGSLIVNKGSGSGEGSGSKGSGEGSGSGLSPAKISGSDKYWQHGTNAFEGTNLIHGQQKQGQSHQIHKQNLKTYKNETPVGSSSSPDESFPEGLSESEREGNRKKGSHRTKGKKEAKSGGPISDDINRNESDADLNAGTPKNRTKGIQNDPDSFVNRGQRRAEFAERWAQDAELEIPGKNYVGEDRARLIRIISDQIVGDVFQMALTRLLLQAESGQDSKRIMQTLKEMQVTGQGNPMTQTRLWTPHLGMSTANLSGSEPPPGPSSTNTVKSKKRGKPKPPVPRNHDQDCPTGQCPDDMVCFYPYFQDFSKF